MIYRNIIAFFLFAGFVGCSPQKVVSTSSSKLDYKVQKQFDDVFYKALKEKSNQNFSGAKEMFLKALEIDPKSHTAMYEIAQLEYKLDSYNSSVDWIQRAIKSNPCLLYTSPSPRDRTRSRMPSSA